MAKQMMQDKASEMAATQTVPTGYQQTEVGVIPEDWDIKELQQICRVPITYGIVQCGPHIVNGIPYIRVSDMTARELDIDGMQRTSPQIAAAFARSTVDEGDIVYALRGKLGFVRSVPSSVAGANLTQGTARISPVSNVFGRYVFWALQSPRSLEQATQGAKGSTFVEITLASLKEIKIPVPRHKEEQKVIADALSDIDELIAGLEQLITKKQAIKTATMQQLLTGRTRLPQFALRSDGTPKGYKSSELGKIPEDWEIIPLVSIGRTIRGVSYNPNNDLYISDSSDSIRLFRSNNILNSRLVFSGLQYVSKNRVSESQKMQLGDILICMANGSKSLVGKSAIHDLNDGYEYTFGAFMGVFRLNDASQSKYVYYLMNSARYRCYIDLILAGSSINNLKPSDIDKLSLAFPDIEEQTAIAAMLSDMDSELAALEQKLAKARDVKQGMMQQLLTGRIRLPLSKEA